jgi:exonuclease SbcD
MMRILHTADWHLGKRLQGVSMHEVQAKFCDWLVNCVQEMEVDVVLVSGDVFDQANPPTEARSLYFDTLSRLSQTGAQVVLTAGNHDSPSMLMAPKELLSCLRIHVVGTWSDDSDPPLIPLTRRSAPGIPVAVVAAVPFIRDHELERLAPDSSELERQAAVVEGVRAIFQRAADFADERHPDMPALAMGHLFATGVSTSDGERDIQVGNLGSVPASAFPERFRYVALGHIHKPQSAGAEHILYSGSPYPLSFSERNDTKRVLFLNLQDNDLEIESLTVPAQLSLKRLSGSTQHLKHQLEVAKAQCPHVTYVEVIWTPEHYDAVNHSALEDFIRGLESETFVVAHFRVRPEKTMVEIPDSLKVASLDELQPKEVFETYLDRASLDPDQAALLKEAFEDLCQIWLQSPSHEDPQS